MKIRRSEFRTRASKVLKSSELLDVRMVTLDCKAHAPVLTGPFSVEASLEIEGTQDEQNDRIEVWSHYRISAGTDGEDARTAWSIALGMVGTWGRTETVDFEEPDLRSFAMAVGAMTIHPYAREVVQSTVSRLGYPPFTMEMLHSAAEGDDNDQIELYESTNPTS